MRVYWLNWAFGCRTRYFLLTQPWYFNTRSPSLLVSTSKIKLSPPCWTSAAQAWADINSSAGFTSTAGDDGSGSSRGLIAFVGHEEQLRRHPALAVGLDVRIGNRFARQVLATRHAHVGGRHNWHGKEHQESYTTKTL